MRIPPKSLVHVLCGMVLCATLAYAQLPSKQVLPHRANSEYERTGDRMLDADDGLTVIAAALNPKVRRHYASGDCSHLVNAIYKQAGFPYAYASSTDLYVGVEGFHRIFQPQPGDLVVWRGHVGIVVQPSRHVFYSFLSKGPTVSDYTSSYWIRRGHARFYRYVKNDPCPGCAHMRQGE